MLTPALTYSINAPRSCRSFYACRKESFTRKLANDVSVRLPWEAEYELADAQVETIVAQNSDIQVQSVSFLGEGWDFYNWLINEQFVFRFPKRHSDIDTLVHERRILEQLDLPLATPQVALWVDQPKNFHKPFMVYRFLPGNPLLRFSSDECDVDELAGELGSALTRLHQQKLTRPLVPVDPISLWQADYTRLIENVRRAIAVDILTEIQQALDSYQTRHRTGHQVTTHNDLGVEHILVNRHFEITAIIDWADAATANGFVDFAGLWAWGGNPALASAFANYYVEPTIEDLAQIRVHGLCYALEQIFYGHRIKNTKLVHTASTWLHERVRSGEISPIYATL